MSSRLKPISQQTIVITGASSGIGLATAYQAAAAGAQVVLASRNEDALRQIVERITSEGGKAHYVVTDVSKHEDIDRLADEAIKTYGGFDTWVNNAGLGLWGRLEEVTDADSRQLFDINFWGIVYGSITALRTLKKTGGALINLGSVASDMAFPLQSMYSVTKHAIKGFTDALRRELIAEGAPVSVTLIQPASIGTPFAEHAKNYTGQGKRLPPPLYAPEDVAHSILYAAQCPRRHVHVGGAGKLMSIASVLMPGLIDRASSKAIQAQLKPGENTAGHDSLWQAGEDGSVRASQPDSSIRRSSFSAVNTHPGTAAALAGVLALAIGLGVWKARS